MRQSYAFPQPRYPQFCPFSTRAGHFTYTKTWARTSNWIEDMPKGDGGRRRDIF